MKPVTRQTYRRRLRRLAEFILTIPEKQWNFAECGRGAKVKGCGCALHHETKRQGYAYPFDYFDQYQQFAMDCFGITRDEATALFNPFSSSCPLPPTATREEVSNHILAFLKQK